MNGIINSTIPGATPDTYPLDVPRGCVAYIDFSERGQNLINHVNNQKLEWVRAQGPMSGPVTGPTGTVWHFNGINDYFDIPVAAWPSSAYWSVEAWAYSKADAGYGHLIEGQVVSSIRSRLNVTTSLIQIAYYTPVERMLNSASLIAKDTWYHFVFTGQPTALTMYINGTLDASVNPGAAHTPQPTDIIRVSRQNSYTWNGMMGKLAFYDRTLTPQEILQTYRNEAWRYGLRG